MKLLLCTLPIVQALREKYISGFFPIAVQQISWETHNTSERHFFSFPFGEEATAQKQTVDISGKTQGDNKGLRKILQAKQHQRIFALWKNVTQLR